MLVDIGLPRINFFSFLYEKNIKKISSFRIFSVDMLDMLDMFKEKGQC